MDKRLYRSSTDKKLSGVCGGIAEYFGVDSTLVRLAFILLSLAGGPGLLLYIVMWALVPENPIHYGKLKNDQI